MIVDRFGRRAVAEILRSTLFTRRYSELRCGSMALAGERPSVWEKATEVQL